MKKLFLYICMLLSFVMTDAHSNQCPKALDFEIKRLGEDKVESLCKYKGNVILVVNTASKCGFTPQYENLQNLFLSYKDTDLTILAITSNSFNQEYSNNEDIKQICLVNYDVGFVTSSPMNVKGDDSHKLFKWLKEEYGKAPKWNFYKFLFDRDGKLTSSWSSMTKPDHARIIKEINEIL